jgi:hypothetical protein
MARRNAIEIQITSPTACIISLSGEHDSSSRLGATLALALAGGLRNVLVDLSECRLADASPATALRLALGRVRALAGALELVVPARSRGVRGALAREDLHRLLPFHTTRAAGIASIAAAEQVGAHGDESSSLRSLSARIDQLEARTESGRVRRLERARSGVTVIRAQIVAGPGWIGAPLGAARRAGPPRG